MLLLLPVNGVHTILQVELYSTGLLCTAAAALKQFLDISISSAAVKGASDANSSSSSLTIKYSDLAPEARSAVAALVQHELQQLGSSMEEDEQLLRDVLRLPTAEGELMQAQQQLQQREQEVVRLDQCLQQQLVLQEQQQQELGHIGAHGEGASLDGEGASMAVAGGCTELSASAQFSSSGGDVGTQGVGSANRTATAVMGEVLEAGAELGCGPNTGSGASEVELAQQTLARAKQGMGEMEQKLRELQAEVEGLQARAVGVKEMAVRYRLSKKRLLQEVLDQALGVECEEDV
jgi:hypothetical protein